MMKLLAAIILISTWSSLFCNSATIGCAERTKQKDCPSIRTKEECLTSTDNRSWVSGQACVWCINGGCPNSANVCEPQTWMEQAPRNKVAGTDFETCLPSLQDKTKELIESKIGDLEDKINKLIELKTQDVEEELKKKSAALQLYAIGGTVFRTFSNDNTTDRYRKIYMARVVGPFLTFRISEAEKTCGTFGMEVVSIDSEAENKFVSELAKEAHGGLDSNVWLGAKKVPGTTKWAWPGTASWEPNTNTIYQNWSSDAEFKDGYDCAIMKKDMTWSPVECGWASGRSVVCEQPTRILDLSDGSV